MKIALGTVQFGLNYGVANSSGQVSELQAAAILSAARAASIDTLDTASAYGTSEQVLGRIGTEGLRVVTKLPPLPEGTTNVRAWVRARVHRSLVNLQRDSVDAVLLHRPEDLLGRDGEGLWFGILDAQNAGLCSRVGFSIYNAEILGLLPSQFEPNLVQAPFNVLDRTLEVSGWAQRLVDQGVAIHIRSAFLQGLLLLPRSQRLQCFAGHFDELDCWDAFLDSTGQDALSTALGFVLTRPWAERVVVGVDSDTQLAGILEAASRKVVPPPYSLASTDPRVIDPRQWIRA